MTRENRWVIASENPRFNLEEFDAWIKEHGETGYFVRIPTGAFDCKYMTEWVFNELYEFASGDTDAMFRRINDK
jgi:hypothetical protein